MKENQTFERNRTGCPIHKRQEKILRVEIGKEVRGYRLIQNHKRRRSEIIEISEPIRLFFFSLDGELDLNPITKPMRIAKYRLCEWVHPEVTTDKHGNRRGDIDKYQNAKNEHDKGMSGCIIVVDEIEPVPIYNQCSECHKYTSHDEERYKKELDFMCVNCFCEQTNQSDFNIWS
tara:strand:+ start:458 stop:982 length:525 start_codon:yes stop_codon:yes gene_type:complete